MDAIDAPVSLQLAELAADIAERVLKADGCALINVFRDAVSARLVAGTRRKFAKVKLCKPEASFRPVSRVVFAG
jgi:23S rRNA U2552 (ribose-2'-O)-methylase RlmE/FtsJ